MESIMGNSLAKVKRLLAISKWHFCTSSKPIYRVVVAYHKFTMLTTAYLQGKMFTNLLFLWYKHVLQRGIAKLQTWLAYIGFQL